jgi:hypothetical protein
MIEHRPINGGKPLCVFIPLTKTVVTKKASVVISEIIKGTARKASKSGDNQTLTVNEISFGVFIPKGPFFSYTGKFGTTDTEFVVYGKDSSIAITQEDLNTLQSITDASAVTVTGTALFFNDRGSNLTFSEGDGIYIRCKPTGKSEETTEVEVAKTTWGNAWTPSTFQIQLFFITLAIATIVIGSLYGVYKLFDMVSPTKPKPASVAAAVDTGFFTNMASIFSFS